MRSLLVATLFALTPASAGAGQAAVLQGAGPDAEVPAAEPDEIRRQMEIGRYWHAARALRDELGSGSPGTPAGTLLLARAEAGWGNWTEVVSLLRGREWLDREDDGAGWLLLGRGAEETGRSELAVDALQRFLRARTSDAGAEVLVARIRRARILARMGASATALEELERVHASAPWASGPLALVVAESAAERGEVDVLRTALSRVPDDAVGRLERLEARAFLVAADTAGALDAFLRLARDAGSDGVRSRSWGRIGELRLARGDSAEARTAFRNGAEGESVDVSVARGLLATGVADAGRARLAFEVLERADEPEEALDALQAFQELRDDDAPALEPTLRLRRARLLARADREAEALPILRELAELDDVEVAAPALDLWSDIRRRQGRSGEARALQNRLVDRFPAHPEAVDVVFFRADDRHDHGNLAGAAEGYRRIVEAAPALDRAGLARMRLGQIHLSREEHEEAARVFEGYLEAFPRGRRWEEAAYWAARSRSALGQADSARALVSGIRAAEPLSYYAVLGARLLDDDFEPDLPEGEAPPEIDWIAERLERARILREAGLEAAAEAVIEEATRDVDSSESARLRLSLELSDAGFSMEGIRLAWRVRGMGRDWDRWLLRAIYPFPYRELVRREAREWGLDPYFLAALVRQESAFVPGIRSGAGAVGLMQVVPATGRGLARSVGPRPFDERLLVRPEVNLHLGGAYVSDLLGRFDGELPLVLSAYNAGPSRAREWSRRFPEVADPLRFTERIPYAETRDYVKRVRRNVEIYRFLYADGAPEAVGSQP